MRGQLRQLFCDRAATADKHDPLRIKPPNELLNQRRQCSVLFDSGPKAEFTLSDAKRSFGC